MIASSILSPAMRSECEYTMPPSEITPTSLVPPPMSSTIEPVGSMMGRSAPIAAAIGSSIRNTSRAPVLMAASRVGRRSPRVAPPGPDRGRHRLFDQESLARAGAHGGFADGAAFDLCRAAGHADHDARTRLEQAVLVHLADEILEHLAGDGEVGDHAFLHRPDRLDRSRRATEHLLGFVADGKDGAIVATGVILTDGDDRGFVQHDALVAHEDQGISGTQVDGDIAGEETTKAFEHAENSVLEGV